MATSSASGGGDGESGLPSPADATVSAANVLAALGSLAQGEVERGEGVWCVRGGGRGSVVCEREGQGVWCVRGRERDRGV